MGVPVCRCQWSSSANVGCELDSSAVRSLMDFRDASSWRILRDDRGDHFMYFDAAREAPCLRDLTEDEKSVTLDKLVSVSGLSTPSGKLGDQMDAFGPQDEVLGPDPQAGFVEAMTFYMKGG